jgi:hypothetical protein
MRTSDPTALLAKVFKIKRLYDKIADDEFTACDVVDNKSQIELLDTIRSLFLVLNEQQGERNEA